MRDGKRSVPSSARKRSACSSSAAAIASTTSSGAPSTARREAARARRRVGPPVGGRAEVDREVERLDVVLGEPGLVERLGDRALRRPAERPRQRGIGRLPEPVGDHLAARERQPRVRVRPGPGGERHAPAGAQHPARLAQGVDRVGHQHVAPAAEDAVEAAGLDVDARVGVDLLEADVRDPQRLGALLGDLEHLGREVRRDQRAGGRDQLRGEQPGVAGAGRELEQRLAGLRVERVDHPRRDRHRPRAHRVLLRGPARGLLAPALAALAAEVVGEGHGRGR